MSGAETGVATVADTPIVAEPAAEPRSRSPMKRSRGFGDRTKLDPEARRRQAHVMRLAMDHLGSADAIRGFLNEPHAGLGGRPLDLAMGSDEGLAAVEAVILPNPAR